VERLRRIDKCVEAIVRRYFEDDGPTDCAPFRHRATTGAANASDVALDESLRSGVFGKLKLVICAPISDLSGIIFVLCAPLAGELRRILSGSRTDRSSAPASCRAGVPAPALRALHGSRTLTTAVHCLQIVFSMDHALEPCIFV
jgi:hypothetical protein